MLSRFVATVPLCLLLLPSLLPSKPTRIDLLPFSRFPLFPSFSSLPSSRTAMSVTRRLTHSRKSSREEPVTFQAAVFPAKDAPLELVIHEKLTAGHGGA
jgi:hypothetical protein